MLVRKFCKTRVREKIQITPILPQLPEVLCQDTKFPLIFKRSQIGLSFYSYLIHTSPAPTFIFPHTDTKSIILTYSFLCFVTSRIFRVRGKMMVEKEIIKNILLCLVSRLVQKLKCNLKNFIQL